MITGSDLREARTRAKLSQQELAKRVGVSLRTVNNWENGRNVPRNSEPTIRTVLEDYLNAGEADSPRLRSASDEELLAELQRRFDELRKEGLAHGQPPTQKSPQPRKKKVISIDPTARKLKVQKAPQHQGSDRKD